VVEPRGLAGLRLVILVPVLSVLAALILGAIFLAFTGENPFEAYGKMVDAAFGDVRAISETLISATPLILTGLAAAVAFKMLIWNIGAEGQFLFGAVFASGIGILIGEAMPAAVTLPVVILAGCGGAQGLPGHQRDHHHADAQLHCAQLHELPHLREQ
jgi:simple sugar transport system permease protein